MRKLLPLLLILPLFSAEAQERPAEVPAKVGVHSDQFATVASGWWINRRCDFLETAEKRAFETLVSQVNRAMQQTYGADWIRRLQGAAKEASDPLPCQEAARAIVESSSETVIALNRDLGGADYDPETSYRLYLERRLKGIAAAVGLAERCSFGPAEGRQDFATLLQRLAEQLSLDWERPDLVADLEAIRAEIAGAETPPCSDRNQAAVLTALMDARSLGVDYGLWSEKNGLAE